MQIITDNPHMIVKHIKIPNKLIREYYFEIYIKDNFINILTAFQNLIKVLKTTSNIDNKLDVQTILIQQMTIFTNTIFKEKTVQLFNIGSQKKSNNYTQIQVNSVPINIFFTYLKNILSSILKTREKRHKQKIKNHDKQLENHDKQLENPVEQIEKSPPKVVIVEFGVDDWEQIDIS